MWELADNGVKLRDRLVYDPVVKGYDSSFFATTTGTPSTNGGNLRFNAAGCASYSQYVYGDFIFAVNVPTTPSSGEAKIWGLENPAAKHGACYFEITGATFRAVSYDDSGTAETTNITWNSRGETWEAGMAFFRILWTKQYVRFYVGDSYANIADDEYYVEHKTRVGSLPVALRILNSDADNTDVDYILAKRIGYFVS